MAICNSAPASRATSSARLSRSPTARSSSTATQGGLSSQQGTPHGALARQRRPRRAHALTSTPLDLDQPPPPERALRSASKLDTRRRARHHRGRPRRRAPRPGGAGPDLETAGPSPRSRSRWPTRVLVARCAAAPQRRDQALELRLARGARVGPAPSRRQHVDLDLELRRRRRRRGARRAERAQGRNSPEEPHELVLERRSSPRPAAVVPLGEPQLARRRRRR